jgi:hypothetical protein
MAWGRQGHQGSDLRGRPTTRNSVLDILLALLCRDGQGR